MRVLVTLLYYYPDRPSGSTRLGFDQAVYMAQQGHEVWVVTQDPTHQQPEYSFRDGLHVLQYPSPEVSTFSLQRLNMHQNLTRKIVEKHIKEPLDVIHGHSILQYDGVLSLYKNKARCVYSIHSPMRLEMQVAARGRGFKVWLKQFITGQIGNQIEKRILKYSDLVTSDSVFTRAMMDDLHGARWANRIQVIPGWVDTDYFQIADDRDMLKRQFGWTLDKPLLFTLRRLVPRNGLDNLLYALADVKSAGYDFQMIIGGSGELRDDLEALTRNLNLQDCVQFIGRVSDEDLPLMYAAGDVFILPTNDLECFGLITLESLASGRPVLATPVGAIPEVLDAVEPKWLMQNASASAIAESIKAYLDGKLPQHNPEDLREYVVSNYAQTYVIPILVAAALGDA